MSVLHVVALQSSGRGPAEDEVDVLEGGRIVKHEDKSKSQKGHTPREERAQGRSGQV